MFNLSTKRKLGGNANRTGNKFYTKKRINFNESLKRIHFKDGKISELVFTKRVVKIKSSDRIIFAIPPTNLNKLFPEFKIFDGNKKVYNLQEDHEDQIISLL